MNSYDKTSKEFRMHSNKMCLIIILNFIGFYLIDDRESSCYEETQSMFRVFLALKII